MEYNDFKFENEMIKKCLPSCCQEVLPNNKLTILVNLLMTIRYLVNAK